MIHEQLTRRIIGCAMQVHRTLKNGFQEVIYPPALQSNLTLITSVLNVNRKWKFITETKVLDCVVNYLECYKLQIRLLLNFGARSLEFKRIQ